ncbi:uncharacterized protein HD556DRAFT_1444244 [Suillus plorans]|uniref:Retrotransposon Copia-like N-terminal domain-containing protein n=1 Tax=Suillus plorans TaxID=116603 RepID=A0A9P7DH62_9AGAM|nr:uncharacterized protein HD556DRAFT_1444244 [Suillus plorans]KAG1792561.1 hypothetical protein HD556DRAFT_1444244 [Suillus plorans]
MGKYDHIIELTGSDDYPSWRRMVTLALQGDGLWNHCSSGTNPNNFADLALVMPTPALPAAPTTAENKEIIDWIKEDAQAKGIICRRLSPVVQTLLDESLTARQQWDILANHFSRLDMTSQFELQMGVPFTKHEAVFLLLHGLPKSTDWLMYKQLTIGQFNKQPAPVASSTSTTTTAPPATVTLTFSEVAASLSEEANRLHGERDLARPRSEYASPATHNSFPTQPSKVNPVTQVRIHKQNPWGQGGGMEGKAPWAQKGGDGGRRVKKEVAAATNEGKPSPSASPSNPDPKSNKVRQLVCAMIEELDSIDPLASPSSEDITCIANQALSTILDLV